MEKADNGISIAYTCRYTFSLSPTFKEITGHTFNKINIPTKYVTYFLHSVTNRCLNTKDKTSFLSNQNSHTCDLDVSQARWTV